MMSKKTPAHFLSHTWLLFIVSCVALVTSGCSGMKNAAEEKPKWTMERPINPNYYIGIAGVLKSDFPYTAKEVAKENALNSLAREIRVQVNSTSLLSTLQVNKFGLQSGESYRAQGRTFCHPNITAYRSPTWTSPIFWTQPGLIRFNGGVSNINFDVYPNPSNGKLCF